MRVRSRRGLLGPVVLLGLFGLAVVSLSEARRQRAHGERLEGQLDGARRDLAVVAAERDATVARLEAVTADLGAAEQAASSRAARIAFLEQELRAALARAESVTEAVAARRAELDALRAELDERRIAAGKPMPEGVRLAVRAFEELLIADGYEGFRIIQARALDDAALHDVELVETEDYGRRVTYYRAERLSVELDRERGAAAISLRNGHAVADGELRAFGEEGVSIELREVDGPEWERRLPYLVRAVGEYPETAARAAADEVLDLSTRDRWRQRVDALLSAADTEVRYGLGGFRTIRDGRFLDAALHGFDGARLLDRSASAARLGIEVDREAGVVALLLEDGVLRRRGGETKIPASGYRILLPGVTPEQALDAMLGFVVER
ncbi:MAG: hypothetical protein O3C51_02295 [Planctomycetota bacterium]|nr:hypothetical protein [Planctomycetota bacterium]